MVSAGRPWPVLSFKKVFGTKDSSLQGEWLALAGKNFDFKSQDIRNYFNHFEPAVSEAFLNFVSSNPDFVSEHLDDIRALAWTKDGSVPTLVKRAAIRVLLQNANLLKREDVLFLYSSNDAQIDIDAVPLLCKFLSMDQLISIFSQQGSKQRVSVEAGREIAEYLINDSQFLQRIPQFSLSDPDLYAKLLSIYENKSAKEKVKIFCLLLLGRMGDISQRSGIRINSQKLISFFSFLESRNVPSGIYEPLIAVLVFPPSLVDNPGESLSPSEIWKGIGSNDFQAFSEFISKAPAIILDQILSRSFSERRNRWISHLALEQLRRDNTQNKLLKIMNNLNSRVVSGSADKSVAIVWDAIDLFDRLGDQESKAEKVDREIIGLFSSILRNLIEVSSGSNSVLAEIFDKRLGTTSLSAQMTIKEILRLGQLPKGMLDENNISLIHQLYLIFSVSRNGVLAYTLSLIPGFQTDEILKPLELFFRDLPTDHLLKEAISIRLSSWGQLEISDRQKHSSSVLDFETLPKEPEEFQKQVQLLKGILAHLLEDLPKEPLSSEDAQVRSKKLKEIYRLYEEISSVIAIENEIGQGRYFVDVSGLKHIGCDYISYDFRKNLSFHIELKGKHRGWSSLIVSDNQLEAARRIHEAKGRKRFLLQVVEIDLSDRSHNILWFADIGEDFYYLKSAAGKGEIPRRLLKRFEIASP